jgi:hypothetical protein
MFSGVFQGMRTIGKSGLTAIIAAACLQCTRHQRWPGALSKHMF